MGRQRDDGHITFRRRQRPDLLGCLHTIEFGHLDVHQHDVVIRVPHRIDA